MTDASGRLTADQEAKDAPRCTTCGRPLAPSEAAAGLVTCEHCDIAAHTAAFMDAPNRREELFGQYREAGA